MALTVLRVCLCVRAPPGTVLVVVSSVIPSENQILVDFWRLLLESLSHVGWSLNNKTNDGSHSVLSTWALTPSDVTYRTRFRIRRHKRPALSMEQYQQSALCVVLVGIVDC